MCGWWWCSQCAVLRQAAAQPPSLHLLFWAVYDNACGTHLLPLPRSSRLQSAVFPWYGVEVVGKLIPNCHTVGCTCFKLPAT